jgi:hypothetical protein
MIARAKEVAAHQGTEDVSRHQQPLPRERRRQRSDDEADGPRLRKVAAPEDPFEEYGGSLRADARAAATGGAGTAD